MKKDTFKLKKRVVVLLPESHIKLTFRYSNLIKIIDEQIISLKEFLLNEEIDDKTQIKYRIRKYMKSIAKNNIASFLSGTALNLLVKLVTQIFTLNLWWLSKILGVFFSAPE